MYQNRKDPLLLASFLVSNHPCMRHFVGSVLQSLLQLMRMSSFLTTLSAYNRFGKCSMLHYVNIIVCSNIRHEIKISIKIVNPFGKVIDLGRRTGGKMDPRFE